MEKAFLSATTNIEKNQDVSPITPSSASSVDDAASSLRAAALLTLKSNKRRKPNDQVAQPSRPMIVDNSVHLDYGQDDIASSPPEVPTRTYSPPSISPQNYSEDGQIREEGEISDTETPTLPASSVANDQLQSASPSSPSKRHAPFNVMHNESSHSNSHSNFSPISTNVESPPPNLLDRISDKALSSQTLAVEQTAVHPFVDTDHVRPGLEMNQEQYDTAKDIVLDLLGWGVPPEYLVSCGLSREIVFYVFSELSLRLPNNFSPEGIVPYAPSTLKQLLRDPNDMASPQESDSSGNRLSDRLSLPSKLSTSGLDHSRTISRRSSAETPGTVLQDMERQRRQELLARKAVQASRKRQHTGSMSPTLKPTRSDGDVEMAPPAPSESVDDFLKSIEPAGSSKMDVDGVPGPSNTSILTHPIQDDPMQVDSDPLVESPSHEVSFPTPPEEHPVASPAGQSSSEDTGGSNGHQRRNSKRPVAADFVDFDTSPKPRSDPSLKRKSGGSFASISTMRRCVIDLSDSEGEEDPEDVQMKAISSGAPSSRYSTPPISAPTPSYRTMSPADLAAKEMEIQKMRQMIAEREQGRVKKLKKLEAMSNADAVVKQEESEPVASLSTLIESPSTNHSSVSNPLIGSAISLPLQLLPTN
ncbi:hypothetical protein GYMLUDRAFT_767922 [Collybiopsis luxurians FD-317 M1]|uniref:Uncharacterized protein n=1 Tax=Collybiopsis luxurians FD-317 M1 TaxID=944289 RepID=A0A0D0BQ96_9AGAR|nr:hypothetical protein GYMLUDRAFT_767922 [Collybiopsis luxurians FD-317 M1]